jgi:hypothetical protein
MDLQASFDKTDVYEAQVKPLLDAAHALAVEHGIALSTYVTHSRDIVNKGESYAIAAGAESETSFMGHFGADALFVQLLQRNIQQADTKGAGNFVSHNPEAMPELIMRAVHETSALLTKFAEDRVITANSLI